MRSESHNHNAGDIRSAARGGSPSQQAPERHDTSGTRGPQAIWTRGARHKAVARGWDELLERAQERPVQGALTTLFTLRATDGD